jgi:hypothetical protein
MTIDRSQELKQQEKKEKKVVKLKVYKNKLIRQEKAEYKKLFQKDLDTLLNQKPNPHGWAVVSWDEEGYTCGFMANSTAEAFTLPEKVKKILEMKVTEVLDDDY